MPNPALTTRLPIDANIVAYYGFDEANETDAGIDEGVAGLDLAVHNAAAVIPARLGNGRQFDGSTTYADLADSDPFREGDCTIIAWITLDSVLNTGSKRRTIVDCSGATGAADDYVVFNLGVRNDGAFIFEHQNGVTGHTILFATTAARIHAKRYYSVVVTRKARGAFCDVNLYIDNTLVPWSTITDNGAPVTDWTEIPSAVTRQSTSTQLFRVGHSARYADSFWHGVIDELSIHKVARVWNTYLRGAYFRLTLAMSFSRLSAVGAIRSIGAAEMGGGSRWWCYERDQSLFVIRENSLGLFSAEVQLATGGTMWNGSAMPAGAEQPHLAYDAVSDTLLVVFLAAGRVYKLTALSEDAASTQNMPYTADTAGIIKVRDAIDLVRESAGAQNLETESVGTAALGDGTVEPAIVFLHTPSFGVAIEGSNAYGYNVYSVVGGVEKLLGSATALQTARFETYRNYYFFPVTSRAAGVQYFVRPRLASGGAGLARSNAITDFLGVIVARDPYDLNSLVWSRDGDYTHDHEQSSAGASVPFAAASVAYVNRTPIKLALTDPMSASAGGANQRDTEVTFVLRTPVKIALLDVMLGAAGQASRMTLTRSGGVGVRIDT